MCHKWDLLHSLLTPMVASSASPSSSGFIGNSRTDQGIQTVAPISLSSKVNICLPYFHQPWHIVMSPSWTKTGSNFILLAPAWWWGVKFVWEGTHLKRKKARIRQSVNEVIGAMGNGGAVRGLLWVIIYFALFTTPPPSALYPPLPTLSRGSWRWCNRARNRCHNSPPPSQVPPTPLLHQFCLLK